MPTAFFDILSVGMFILSKRDDSMKNLQQITFVAVGLALGLLIGMVAVNITTDTLSEDDVRQIVAENNAQILAGVEVALAGDGPEIVFQRRQLDLTDANFFLVTMEETAEWLEEFLAEFEDMEISEELLETILAANAITTGSDLELFFTEQVNTVDGVLANVYQALLMLFSNGAMPEEFSNGEDLEFEVCLGLDNDPYSIAGPVIYLYLQVAEELTDEVPKDWEMLSGPRQESMLWSAECFDPELAAELAEEEEEQEEA